MKKRWIKIVLLAALLCVVFGMSLLIWGYRMNGHTGIWLSSDGIRSGRQYKEKRIVKLDKVKLDPLQTIDVNISWNDLLIVPSKDDSFYMEYEMTVGSKDPTYECKDGNLVVKYEQDSYNTSVQFYMFDNWEDKRHGYVKIYVPQGHNLSGLAVKNSDGAIEIDGMNADSITVAGGYGKITLNQTTAQLLTVTLSDAELNCTGIKAVSADFVNSYGKTVLDGIEVSEKLTLTCSDGAVTLSDVNVPTIFVTNEYGNIDGNGIKAEQFKVKASDGHCEFTGMDVMKCELTNEYGDIKLTLAGREEDYNFDLNTSFGSIQVNKMKIKEEDGDYKMDRGAERSVVSSSSDGKLVIQTEK